MLYILGVMLSFLRLGFLLRVVLVLPRSTTVTSSVTYCFFPRSIGSSADIDSCHGI